MNVISVNVLYKVFSFTQSFDLPTSLLFPVFLVASLHLYGLCNPKPNVPACIDQRTKVLLEELRRILGLCDRRGFVTTADKLRMIAIVEELLEIHKVYKSLSLKQARELKKFLASIS